MTKIYDIVHCNGFMYGVDKKAKCPKGCTAIFPNTKNGIIITYNAPVICKSDYAANGLYNLLVITSNDPSLNLPLLPSVEEVENENILEMAVKALDKLDPLLKNDETIYRVGLTAWFDAYKAASAKKYTEEDLRRAIYKAAEVGFNFTKGTIGGLNWDLAEGKAYEIIRSLNPLPIAVEVEIDYKFPSGREYIQPSPDLVLLVENNFVKVVKWIYE